MAELLGNLPFAWLPPGLQVVSTNRLHSTTNLFECFGGELRERLILYAVTDLDRVAADFAVFDVGLASNRKVKNHRNLFPTIGAGKGMFHQMSMLQQSASRSFSNVSDGAKAMNCGSLARFAR
jgi:hypothetical protein